MINRSTGTAPLLVFSTALAVRLVYLGLSGVPSERIGDAVSYHSYAVHILESGRYEGLNGERASRGPGYPLFLALIYGLVGTSLPVLAWVQCLLGSLTCVLVFSLAGQMLSPPWPLACGLGAATYGGLVMPCVLPYSETLYSFCLAFSAAGLFHKSWPWTWRAASGGLGWGFVSWVRPEPLPFLTAAAAFSDRIISGFNFRGRWLLLGSLLFVMSLWTGRNYLLLHRFIPATTSGGFNLYVGLRIPMGLIHGDAGPYEDLPETDELRKNGAYLREFKKLWGALNWEERFKAYSYNIASVLYPFLPGYDLTFVFWVPFWIVGLWVSCFRKEWFFFSGFILFSFAIYTVFGGPVSRYRQGFSPLLLLVGGLGLQELSRRMDARRFKFGLSGWLAFNFLVWIVGEDIRRTALGLKAWVW